MSTKKIAFFTWLLIGTLVFPCLVLASHEGELRIWIREKATVTGDTIKLGDIATFTPEEDDRVSQLREQRVSAAPAPGRDLTLNSRFLIYRLSSVVGGDKKVRVKVPRSLLVHRDGQVVSARKLADIFKQYVFRHAPWRRKDMELEKVQVPGPIVLPHGDLSWNVAERNGGNFVGDLSLVISFSVDGRVYRKVPVRGRILVNRTVVKSGRNIQKGEIIGAGDLVELTVKTGRSGGTNVRSIKEVVGKRAARSLREGQVITREMVEIPPAVRKGDRVIIKAENNTVAVSALGKVLEDGHSGEQVRVMNISSGKEIFAKVTGPGQVRVTF